MFWGPSKDEMTLDDAVRSAAKYATAFKAVPVGAGSPPSIVSTKFGGEAYAEAGEVWPTVGDRPCDFICQFNLKECVDGPAVPFRLVSVFLSWVAWEAGDSSHCVVRSYSDPDPSKAVTLVRPPAVDAQDYCTIACSVEASRVVTYPASVDTFLLIPSIAEAARRFRDPRKAYLKSLKRLGYKEEFGTQVFGYPSWIQGNSLEQDDNVFLAQIGSEDEANLMFGDAGVVFVCMSPTPPLRFVTDTWQCF